MLIGVILLCGLEPSPQSIKYEKPCLKLVIYRNGDRRELGFPLTRKPYLNYWSLSVPVGIVACSDALGEDPVEIGEIPDRQ